MSRNEYGEICPAAMALNAISGKWKLPVVARLLSHQRRFSELKEELEGISSKVLSKALKELEEDGIVERQVFGEMPVRIEYGLTEIGRQLKPVLLDMKAWGERYLAANADNESTQGDDPKGSSF